ncbi:MAG: hypothetical protein JO011_22140 [Ktedonobacteraceae bacterium]|nr:hypothetical protein [Ktedonobacteraceae bacterium]MBV9713608.1 hypothetical protein [Ktedonobacteraceae bacterium]
MPADVIYHLDLPTLFHFLGDQSAVLSTTVAAPPLTESCYGYLLFRNRAILDCQIQSQDGTLLCRGQEAYQMLSANTQWHVRIASSLTQEMKYLEQQETAKSLAKAPSSISDTYIPHVIASLDPSLLNGYTMKQRVILRTVLAMVNGQRTVAQMKEQLHLSPEAVDEALTSLKSIYVIQ